MVALRKVYVLAALAALTGCATTSDGSASLHPGHGKFQADADYIHVVESVARHKGVQVVWVNPPTEEGKDYVRRSVK